MCEIAVIATLAANDVSIEDLGLIIHLGTLDRNMIIMGNFPRLKKSKKLYLNSVSDAMLTQLAWKNSMLLEEQFRMYKEYKMR